MVMQDVNYQLFAESVFAECKLGIENVSDDLIEEIYRIYNLCHKGSQWFYGHVRQSFNDNKLSKQF